MTPKPLLTPLALLAALLPAAALLAGTSEGECLEHWELPNFQPRSDTFEQLVPSSHYRARATVILLLSSG